MMVQELQIDPDMDGYKRRALFDIVQQSDVGFKDCLLHRPQPEQIVRVSKPGA